MKLRYALLTLAAMTGTASAASIAMNFIENNANQVFGGGTNIGPTSIDSSNWNSSAGFTLAGDTITAGNVIDDSGNTVAGATITWGSGGPYYNGAGTGNDEQKLFVGYLDDTNTGGGIGASFMVTNHGYAMYDLYVLATGDAGNGSGGTATFTHTAINVNGVAGSTYTALGYNGSTWVETTGGTPGNYVKFSGLTAATLSVTVDDRNGGERGPVNGFVMVQVPEPSYAALLGLGGLALILRRRK